jgi:hypothetical protein
MTREMAMNRLPLVMLATAFAAVCTIGACREYKPQSDPAPEQTLLKAGDRPVSIAFAVPGAGVRAALDQETGAESEFEQDDAPPSDEPEATAKECSDGKDNDGDGLVDWQYDLGCYGAADPSEGGLQTRELDNGWTVFEPSKDTRIIYVSSSVGNDANRGRSPAKPKKTLAAALRAVRANHPDWVLLRRGDTWMESLTLKEGRSRIEPFLVASYGESTQRPLLKTGTQRGIYHKTKPFDYLAVVGIAFYAHTRDPDSSDYVDESGQSGFGFFARHEESGRGVLIEDCWFSFYTSNTIQGPGVIEDVVLRRNIISNNYNDTGHSQGLYAKNASVLLEENVFDHNGWYKQDEPGKDRSGGQATIYNHNTYFVDQKKTTFRRNIFLRASSMGNKWTANSGPASATDIVIDDNLYVDGELGIGIGGNDSVAPHRFKNVTITNNVLMDIGRSRPTGRRLGWYLTIDDWDGGRVSRNLFLHQPSTDVRNVHAIHIRGVTRDVVLDNNVIHGVYTKRKLVVISDQATPERVSFVNNQLQSQLHPVVLIDAPDALANYTFKRNAYYSSRSANEWFQIGGKSGDFAAWKKASRATGSAKKVAFPDSTRSIETYQKSLGKTATIDAFISEALRQSKYNWRTAYTAAEVNEWIRAGFLR